MLISLRFLDDHFNKLVITVSESKIRARVPMLILSALFLLKLNFIQVLLDTLMCEGYIRLNN